MRQKHERSLPLYRSDGQKDFLGSREKERQRQMNWLARMFTIPRAVRKKIDANPLTPYAVDSLLQGISASLDDGVKDPLLNGVYKQAIGAALLKVGILKR
jgi:hypothetical protein